MCLFEKTIVYRRQLASIVLLLSSLIGVSAAAHESATGFYWLQQVMDGDQESPGDSRGALSIFSTGFLPRCRECAATIR